MSEDVMNRLLAAVERLEAGQAKLEAGQAKLEAGHARLEAGQAKLRGDLMARMDRLQDPLTAIQNDIFVNMRRADRAEDRANTVDHRVTLLAGEVTAMHLQIERLQSDMRGLRGEA